MMPGELFQEDAVRLGIFAEQSFCKTCPVKDCSIFYTGNYEGCPELMKVFKEVN